jgi:hypothetical protein
MKNRLAAADVMVDFVLTQLQYACCPYEEVRFPARPAAL